MASTALAPFLGQPGRNGGTLRRGNPGLRGTLSVLQARATLDLGDALKLARTMLHDEELRPAERLAAAEFIRRCTGIDRAAPPARAKPASFGVVRAPAAELAAQVDTPRPRGGKRKKGPPSEKGLGGTRVAPPGESESAESAAAGVDKSSPAVDVDKSSKCGPAEPS